MALSANRDTREIVGALVQLTVADTKTAYAGGLAAVDATGKGLPAADAANLKVLGRFEHGAAAGEKVMIKHGTFLFANKAADPVTVADIGGYCYVTDDETVQHTANSNAVIAGVVRGVTDDGVYVDTAWYVEIAATWDAKARSRAFFSARVADATILSELHNRVAAVIEGKMTKTQARDLIRRYFVGEGADALAALGFAPQGDGKGLTQLASAARLKLIFDTNVKMAQEVGQYQQWQEMSHVYRYGIWKAGHAEEHRQEHLARDGKAYAFDHPIWTQSPPGGEFNCHCYRILARDEDLQERGITPEPLGSNFEASSLGFDPSRDLDPPEFGKRVLPEYREKAQAKIDAFAIKEYEEVDNREAAAKLDAIKNEWSEQQDAVEAVHQAEEAAALKRSLAAKKAAETRRANKLAAEKAAQEQAAAEAERQAKAATIKEFPTVDEVRGLKVLGNPGGTTGAELVEDKHGNRYIRKTGGAAGGDPAAHLRNECATDAAYRALGVNVPEFKLYETEAGPVKLSRFVPDARSLGDWWNAASVKERQLMRDKLQADFDVDVVLGNRDVVGEVSDNILVDKNGRPWRIDNGGALGFRAQGKRKDDKDWAAGWPDDLFTMSTSSNNAPFFGEMTPHKLAESIADSGRNWDEMSKVLADADKAVVAKRLKEIRELSVRGKDFIESGYTGEYADRILFHSHNLSKEGFREEVPASISKGNFGFCRSNTPIGAPVNREKAKEAEVKNKILSAVKTVNHHNGPNGDKKPDSDKIKTLAGVKTELAKLAKEGNASAKYYLDNIETIEQAAKEGSTVPLISFDHEIFKAPVNKAPEKFQYVSLTDHIHDYMKRNGGDPEFIRKWQDSQGGDSYASAACDFKVVHLRACGIHSAEEAKDKGYYTGWGEYRQSANLKNAFEKAGTYKDVFDKNYETYAQYHAATQLVLENADFEGRDHATRSVILGRTEDIGSVITCRKGQFSNHSRGAAESHSIFSSVVIKGSGMTVVRTPYSRINGMYFLERTPGQKGKRDDGSADALFTH